jgi:cytochrome c oxidase subunit 1
MEAGTAPVAAVRSAATAVGEEAVKALVRRYVYATTAVFLVAGALGLLMRQSQADVFRIGDNFWYASMTAHGLGAFMAWGAFAVMGFGYWVLKESGFELRPVGYRLAQTTWWLTVVGTGGIIATTLLMGFAGSWVFLYPLPFFSADQWGEFATATFAASVLLVGVGILTWCASILHTVVGPANPAKREFLTDRVAVALGMGIIFKKRFPIRDSVRDFPYAVIPLTVIAIDMLIATLPLAALLVVMILEAINPSISVDPLLAKNMLWFFGHPVVYLLLFPGVAILYLLVPRYAGRPLAAAEVIGLAWLIAVVANVVIWAHHIYIDFPEDSAQSVINVAMQPLTFSITLVSALSLYSLSATIWKSNFRWTPASKFLVAGMIGWITAGLSGVVNATIALDVDVHNTLWVVGHFHHMAVLTIGAFIFGATYAFLPKLTGKKWYSEKLANWHLWLTMIGGYGTYIPWLIQGLTGGPRRWSVLPDFYEPWTLIAIPFMMVMAVGQIIFVYNMVQTLRGKVRANDDRSFFADSRQISLAGTTLAVGVIIPVVALGISQIEPRQDAVAAVPDKEAKVDEAAVALFADNCGSCHVLEVAGTTGSIGPNLDTTLLNEADVLEAIEIGGRGSGAMPAGLLQGEEAKQVAELVGGR